MSSPATYIKRAVLDITMPEAYRDKGYEDLLSKAMLAELNEFIEEEIGKVFPGDERVIIDSLSIDIGPLRSENSEKEFVEKFKAIFPGALRNTLPEQTSQGSKTEMIREFLEHGTFPWWAPQHAGNDPDGLIRSLEPEEFVRLATWLRGALARPAVRERVAGQLRPATLEQLLNVMLGKNGAIIQQTVSATLHSLQRSGITWRTGAQREPTNWLLEQLATQNGKSTFETGPVLSALLAEISQDTQVLLPELTAAVMRQVDSSAAPEVKAVLAALPQDSLASSAPGENEAKAGEENTTRKLALQVLSHFVLYGSIPPALFRGDEKALIDLLVAYAKEDRRRMLLFLQPALQDPKLLLRMFRQVDERHQPALFDVFFPGRHESAVAPARKLIGNLEETGTFRLSPASRPAMAFSIATLDLARTFHLLRDDTLPLLLRPYIAAGGKDVAALVASRAFTSLPEPVQQIVSEKVRENVTRDQEQLSSGTKQQDTGKRSETPTEPAPQLALDEAAAFLSERFLADLVTYYIREQHLPWWSRPLRTRGLLPGSFNPENERDFFSAALDYFVTHHTPALQRLSATLIAQPETRHRINWLLPLPDLLKIAAAALGRENFGYVTVARTLLEKLSGKVNNLIPGSAVRDLIALLFKVAGEKGSDAEPAFRAFITQLSAETGTPFAELANLAVTAVISRESNGQPEQESFVTYIARLEQETTSRSTAEPVHRGTATVSSPGIRFRPATLSDFAEQILSGKIAQLPPANPQELEEAILFSATQEGSFSQLVKNAIVSDAPAAQWMADTFSPEFSRKLFLALTANTSTLHLAEKTIGLLHPVTGSRIEKKELLFLAARAALQRKEQPAGEFIAAFILAVSKRSGVKVQTLHAALVESVAGELFRQDELRIDQKRNESAADQQPEGVVTPVTLTAGDFLLHLDDKTSVADKETRITQEKSEGSTPHEPPQATKEDARSIISAEEEHPGELRNGGKTREEILPGEAEAATPGSVAAAWQSEAESKIALFLQTLLGNVNAFPEAQLFIREERRKLLERLSATENLVPATVPVETARSWEMLAAFVEEKFVRELRLLAGDKKEQEISGKETPGENKHIVTEQKVPGENEPVDATASVIPEKIEQATTPGKEKRDVPPETPHKPETQQQETAAASRDKLFRDPVFLVNTLIYFLQHLQLPWWSPYKSTEELSRFAAQVIPGNRKLVAHHLGQLLADDELKRLVSSQLGDALHDDSSLWERQLNTGFVIRLLRQLLDDHPQDETLRSFLDESEQLVFLSEEHFNTGTAEQLLLALLAEIEASKTLKLPGGFLPGTIDEPAWQDIVTKAGESFAAFLAPGTDAVDTIKAEPEEIEPVTDTQPGTSTGTVSLPKKSSANEQLIETAQEKTPGFDETQQLRKEEKQQTEDAVQKSVEGKDGRDTGTPEEINREKQNPGQSENAEITPGVFERSETGLSDGVDETPGIVPVAGSAKIEKTSSAKKDVHLARAIEQFREPASFFTLLQQLREKAIIAPKQNLVKAEDVDQWTAAVSPLLQPVGEQSFVAASLYLPALARLVAETAEQDAQEQLLRATVTLIAFMNGTGNRQVLNRILRQPESGASPLSATLTNLRQYAAAPPAPSLPLLAAELTGLSENIAPSLVSAEKIMRWSKLLARTLPSIAAAGPVLVALVVKEMSRAANKTTEEIITLVSEKLDALKPDETAHSLTAAYLEEAKAKTEIFDAAGRNPYTSMFSTLRQRTTELGENGPLQSILAEKLSKTLMTDRTFLSALEKAAAMPAGKPKPQPQPQQPHEPWLYPEKKEKKGEPIYVFNSGLVLFWPFIGGLFRRLGYIAGKEFVDVEKQVRAVHLLQYMVDESEQPPEHLLPLNKLFCGMHPSAPLDRWITLTEEEKNEAGLFAASVKAKWEVLKNTSMENFRKGFLQREGLLYHKDPNWELQVQRIAMDMLLQKLPWGFSTVKFPWNEGILFVKWKI